ncbi:YheC/YheD family protein [Anaerobacillus sp. MEB173]|uniref:YheC/YheD family endospore coat-associated protein n=1 Tax=Anaerobacillus sp. MEB173 TaxID=3383345 RepID=UPI003F8F1D41
MNDDSRQMVDKKDYLEVNLDDKMVKRIYTIGILVSKTNKRLKKSLDSILDLMKYCKNDQVCVFSLKGINREKQIIHGYVYCTYQKVWKPSTFKVPDAIINRISLTDEWETFFKKMIGCKMINNFTFSKWEMYKWLSGNAKLGKYLPVTRLICDPKDIIDFLEQHEGGYIKPNRGSYGRGIIKVWKHENYYKVDSRENKEQKVSLNMNLEELKTYFVKLCKKRNYIIQQVIDLYIAYRPIDFRLILVKDGSGEWKDAGLIARKGKKNEIVSNTGLVKSGNTALQNLLLMRRHEAIECRKKMTEISLEAVKEMEKYGGVNGNLGNLGIDLGIDKNRNLWIIEINHRNPRHQMAVDAGDSGIYFNAIKLMMDYANTLAHEPKDEHN